EGESLLCKDGSLSSLQTPVCMKRGHIATPSNIRKLKLFALGDRADGWASDGGPEVLPLSLDVWGLDRDASSGDQATEGEV
ncbi:MAG: hypothetical protein ACO3VS_10800, partial [Limisphaerales bacterium]